MFWKALLVTIVGVVLTVLFLWWGATAPPAEAEGRGLIGTVFGLTLGPLLTLLGLAFLVESFLVGRRQRRKPSQ